MNTFYFRTLLLLGIALTSFESTLFSQVNTIEISGEQYNVYPIREQINIPVEYWIAVDDKAYFQDPENYFNVFGEKRYFNRALFDTSNILGKELLYEQLESSWKRLRKKEIGFGSRFKKAVRSNPAAIVMPNYKLNTDILPPFGAIPDGKYVQLLNNFCFLEEDGSCSEQNDRAAAYFTIKDNLMEGEAVWVDLQGDTIKKGSFTKGVRDGEWTFKQISSLGGYLTSWQVKPLKSTGSLYLDTIFYKMHYKNGVLNGPYSYFEPKASLKIAGTYTDGNPSGNWQTHFDEALIYSITYADPENKFLSHKPLIRTELLVPDQSTHESDVSGYTYGRFNLPTSLVAFDFGIDEELELEEEEFQSYVIENEYNQYNVRDQQRFPARIMKRFEDLNMYRYDLWMFDLVYDPNREITETRGYFTDSLGVKYKFDGNYEIFYPNGQLYFRYIFEDGELVDEGTVFWDNGQPYDVVEHDADSNFYYRKTYDYNGLPMRTLIYDSIGDFLRYDEEIREKDVLEIDGITAERERSDYIYYKPLRDTLPGNFVFSNYDILDTLLPTEPVSLYRMYNGYDKKTLMSEILYDPVTRSYTDFEKSYTGNEYYRVERTFSEDFDSWNGSTTWTYGEFKYVRTSSAILDDMLEKDSIAIRNVLFPFDRFNVTTDVEIFKDGELYTGPVVMKHGRTSKFKGKKLKIKEGYYSGTRKKNKKLYQYLVSGKNASDPDLGIIMTPNGCSYVEGNISNFLFEQANSGFFYYNDDGRYLAFDFGYNNEMQAAKIKGKMVEGKPQGTWIGKSSGKLTNEINFDRGEPFGTYKQYGIQRRASKYRRNRSFDSLPSSKQYYLDITQEFVNGMAQGDYIDRNWYGEVEEQGTFQDDAKNGPFVSKNKIAYSISEFKDGYLDGYVQTYLTLPEMDTILLYDINFQHGLLNGESNAYHTNGKLAKRGFFLDGQPIDDYEAFDEVGFRFHYVRFKYGFPVEEKIWEENELSLRYIFDWKDSIYFDPSDITSTVSLEALMIELGYGGGYVDEEYYGRKRIINKEGLTYNMTKYYPNDTVARIGDVEDSKKVGDWKFYNYEGEFLYEIDYFDSIIQLNDSIRFKSKGVLTDFNKNGNPLYKAFIIEKMEKYDCAHTDHYEIRQLYTTWEDNDSTQRMNGYVQNFYDNGVLQNEGEMKDGLPSGLWKFYDPFGKLNLIGSYHQGKRNGRWLQGDLEKKKYLGEICLNPNIFDLEAEKEYRENLLDVTIITYRLGQATSKQFYDLNLNQFSDLLDE